ncbi:hypothetical protein GLE_2892 [Lysobacter enzymogenes]|uniref:Uncharacterized protein n=1 Tax=Lysobacter enzymogenes TaxID=69 RepID=A0A0S2DID6_LYSEN|nr:hypothetical protein GLE_2892 [Lysobacter enzymogenes]
MLPGGGGGGGGGGGASRPFRACPEPARSQPGGYRPGFKRNAVTLVRL